MPIDRDDTLKRAEKLLRQGRLDAAIAEYARVADEYPRDWNTINLLGDLHARAGHAELAAGQFTRIADHLAAEGFHAKASALYKKALKVRPDAEHVLMQLGEIAARQGLVADARQYLGAVAEKRRARGDRAGLAQILVTLASIEPDDVEAQIRAARAAFEAGDQTTGRRVLTEIATEYESRDRGDLVLAVLEEALRHDPQDAMLRERMTQVLIAAGDATRAREFASTAEELDRLASLLEAGGQASAALEARIDAVRRAPDDPERRRTLVRTLAAQGKTEQIASFLTAEIAGDDPELLRALALMELRAGRIDAGRAALARLANADAPARGRLVAEACDLAHEQPEAGFACLEVVVDAATGRGDCEEAVAALREFLAHVPGHRAALMKLVEVCVDGGLEASMLEAQAQLADAYLAAGLAGEARVVAEDLVVQHPENGEHVARLRRALELLGESDPDQVIRERLALTDTVEPFDVGETLDEPVSRGSATATEGSSPRTRPEAAFAEEPRWSIDQDSILAPLDESDEESSDEKPIELQALEIDLSDLLAELEGTVRPPLRSAPAAPVSSPASPGEVADGGPSLESVFELFRDEAARDGGIDTASEQHERGIRLLQDGHFDEGVAALETAARAPQLRFAASARLGRAWLARGDHARGIEWLERAADAPASTPQEHLALLYDLGDALERAGEAARALAVFMELGATADAFRDVQARVERLTRAQSGG